MITKNKYTILLFILAGSLISLQSAYSKEEDHSKHDHSNKEDKDSKKIAGPNGGRVIESIEPHLEFLVTSDRKVQITFFDDKGHTITPSNQKIKLIGGDRSAPTALTFSMNGDVLISNESLPSGDNLPIVLQIKTSADSPAVTEKFILNTADCPGCKYKEYACICSHD